MSKRPHMLTHATHLVIPMPEGERAPLAAGGRHAVLQRGTVRHSRTGPTQTPSERLWHETQQAASRASSAAAQQPHHLSPPCADERPSPGSGWESGKDKATSGRSASLLKPCCPVKVTPGRHSKLPSSFLPTMGGCHPQGDKTDGVREGWWEESKGAAAFSTMPDLLLNAPWVIPGAGKARDARGTIFQPRPT